MAGQPDDSGTHVDTGALNDAYDELPPDLPARPLGGPSLKPTLGVKGVTNTQFAVSAVDDDDFGPAMPMRRHEPAPARQRPTLLPEGFEQPPKLPGAPRVADPALVRPVRPAADSAKPNVGGNVQESSDVIQVYDTGGAGEMKRATMHSMAPPRTVPPNAGMQPVPPPPRPPQRKSPTVQPPVRPQPAAPPASYQAPPAPVTHTAPPPGPALPLPLHPDQMVDLIASHRGRLGSLDSYARALEIAAGVLGTTAAGFLIATLVGLLVGSGHTLLGAAAALVAETAGLALTILMLGQAASLRHQASAASQLAALLEALSQQRR